MNDTTAKQAAAGDAPGTPGTAIVDKSPDVSIVADVALVAETAIAAVEPVVASEPAPAPISGPSHAAAEIALSPEPSAALEPPAATTEAVEPPTEKIAEPPVTTPVVEPAAAESPARLEIAAPAKPEPGQAPLPPASPPAMHPTTAGDLVPESQLKPESQPTPKPAQIDTKNSGVPAAVLALSDTELKAAAAYYLRKNQTEISRKGVQARQDNMRRQLDAITVYIKQHGSVQIPRLSRDLNLSPGLASHYLQILVKGRRVVATGWAKDRRFSI